MGKRRLTKRQQERRRERARQLLESPRFFNQFLAAIREEGLVGEEKNALVLLVVGISRFLDKPLNVIVKGRSSAGKNWLATRVLRFVPKSNVREITSASTQAWNYADDDFRHRIVYLQERNEAAGAIHPARLLISEGRLIRIVTVREYGRLSTKRFKTEGPIALISTTTKDQIEIDDETRHISIWMDESVQQTKKIVSSYIEDRRLSAEALGMWRTVQNLLAERAGDAIALPSWLRVVAEKCYVEDLRVRRYFPAFLQACRSVCLIRSFQKEHRAQKPLKVSFADFAITALIFDSVFTESLHRAAGQLLETRDLVARLAAQKGGKGVGAAALSKELNISPDRAYRLLRKAADAGSIHRTNRPTKGNLKLFLPAAVPRFLPDPEDVFQTVDHAGPVVKFVHPLSGELVVYKHH